MSSKITQTYENLVTRHQENPKNKTSRNGTVAGYARSALDTWAATSARPLILSCLQHFPAERCFDSLRWPGIRAPVIVGATILGTSILEVVVGAPHDGLTAQHPGAKSHRVLMPRRHSQ